MELSHFVMCILTVISMASANPVRYEENFHEIIQDLRQLLNEEIVAEAPKYMDQVLSDVAEEELNSIPDEKDWRKDGYVSAIKNQGQCASCWSFTATGTMEGQWYNSTGHLIQLSEQNLVDCAKDNGCDGGSVKRAFIYMRDEGIEPSHSYPYKGKKGTCSFNLSDSIGTLTDFKRLRGTNEAEIMKIVAKHGPVSIYVFMSEKFLNFRGTGIFNDPKCNKKPNHAVVVVGYVNKPSEKYWIIKNSWGTSWGDQGYMKMIMNKNMCNMNYLVYYPIV
ncbi:procathepsin L-like [Heptranchias perlo]|uniref:procathepsin L-like n=1 Tax=Heptranchias perlo TaxID=212740 RepID=UPI00355A4360